ncbi:YqzL family protein [Anaerophilus nitritogenes]|nr:YqzL family protein [Anaerophilus nitritogenes]
MLEKMLWNLFLVTGDVDIYLDYKELEEQKEQRENKDIKDVCF